MKRFVDYSLTKKANITLLLLVIVPVFIFGAVVIVGLYKTNTSELYEMNYENLRRATDKLDDCFERAEDIQLECMLNQSLQRIAAERVIGRDYLTMRNWLDEIYLSSPYYENICISLKNGRQFQAGQYIKEEMDDVLEKTEDKNSVWEWEGQSVYALPYANSSARAFIFYARIEDYHDIKNKEPVGTVSIRLDEQKISEMYGKEMLEGYERISLIRSDGEVISSTDKNRIGLRDLNFLNAKKKTEGMYWEKASVIFYRYSGEKEYYLTVRYPFRLLYSEIIIIVSSVFFALVLCLSFGLVFGVIQKKYVIQPIFHMIKAFGNMEQMEFRAMEVADREDEIGILQKAFNQTAEKLDVMINRVYRADFEKQQARLRALTEQINPHFLYNTLDSIHWKAIRNKDHEVAEQIVALSDVYRYLLSQGKEFITVREEVRFQEKYLYLMNMRFGKRLTWESRISNEVMELELPKMIVQPLLENAIVHGIEPFPDGGNVLLEMKMEADDFVVVLKDGGAGFGYDICLKNDEIEKLEGSFALKNINRRLKLYYPEGYEYVIQSFKTGGTVVTIRIRREPKAALPENMVGK